LADDRLKFRQMKKTFMYH